MIGYSFRVIRKIFFADWNYDYMCAFMRVSIKSTRVESNQYIKR